jgi:hypothetical protein
VYYENRRLLRKGVHDKAAVVPNPSVAQPLPFVLKPGAVWIGITLQDPKVEEWATTGILDMLLYHSHNQKPLRQRVVIKKKNNAQT